MDLSEEEKDPYIFAAASGEARRVPKLELVAEVESATASSNGLVVSESESETVTETAETAPTAPPSAAAPPSPSPSKAAKSRNPIWDTLVELFGYEPAPGTEASAWGRTVKDLKAASATPDEMRQRAANHALLLDAGVISWTLTPRALASHWGELGAGGGRSLPVSNGRARAAPRAAAAPPDIDIGAIPRYSVDWDAVRAQEAAKAGKT